MAEHDQRFKTLLKEFFPEFLTLFFPERAARFDFSRIEWLDKELFTDPPEGDVYVLDLVARLRVLTPAGETTEAVALVHVEVESREAVAQFRKRMYQYYESLRREHGLPVLPVAVYLRVGLDGIGVERYVEEYDGLEVLRFQYLYVGLPALDAQQYVAGENWLGVALSALMRIARAQKALLQAEALRRLLLECEENKFRRLMLANCVLTYSRTDAEQQREYQQLLLKEPYKEIEPTMNTLIEQAIDAMEQAQKVNTLIEQARAQGQRQSVRVLLEHRFGPLSPAVLQRLDAWPAEKLEDLLVAVLHAPSLRELGLEE